uniref:Uncharacterized protein n=1 Tax=Fagus sylvatica TaxID=28930 RepID=A0A2N9I1L2_FAGSY
METHSTQLPIKHNSFKLHQWSIKPQKIEREQLEECWDLGHGSLAWPLGQSHERQREEKRGVAQPWVFVRRKQPALVVVVSGAR